MQTNAIETELEQFVIDPAVYQHRALCAGSHPAALVIHLKEAGLGRRPREFVRDFLAVDLGAREYPTLVCYVPSGAWACLRADFGAVIEGLRSDPGKDEELLRMVEFLDLYRRDPNHPFLRVERLDAQSSDAAALQK